MPVDLPLCFQAQIGRKRPTQIIRLLKANLVTFSQVLDPGRLERPTVHENVFTARLGTNEFITSGSMKHLYDAGWHSHSFPPDLQSSR